MRAQDQAPPPDQLIRQSTGFSLLGIGRTTAWRRMNPADPNYDPDFPVRVLIGPCRYGFRQSDLLRYIAARPEVPKAVPAKEASVVSRALASARSERREERELEVKRERARKSARRKAKGRR